jgi:hypothetical protein
MPERPDHASEHPNSVRESPAKQSLQLTPPTSLPEIVSSDKPRPALLLESEGAVLELAGALVGVDRDATTRGLRVDELQSGGDGSTGEEALAVAHHDRENPQPILVDEIVFKQRLDQLAAPGHLDLGSRLFLEPRNRLGDVALERFELFHVTSSRVREATYFGTLFSFAATGSSSPTWGQWAAKIS